jgi:glycerophosphoryl diester phosphodiesterase
LAHSAPCRGPWRVRRGALPPLGARQDTGWRGLSEVAPPLLLGGPIDPRPLIVAHRTCPLDAPENTVAGIVAAARLGADAVEIDVRRTRDGDLVLMHDPTAWRLAHRPVVVRRATGARMDRLRLGATGVPVNRLGDVIEALPAGLGLAVDLKDAAAMPAVVAALRAAGALDGARLWCRVPAAVTWAARAAPGSEVALLRNTRSERDTLRYLDDAVGAGAAAVSLHQRAVSRSIVDVAHERGLVVYAWVVEPAAHRDVIGTGVDGVVTDWIDIARAEREARAS